MEKCHKDEVVIMFVLMGIVALMIYILACGTIDLVTFILIFVIVIPLIADVLDRINKPCPLPGSEG